MDDTEDDARYPLTTNGTNHQKFSDRGSTYGRNVNNQYVEDHDNDDDDEEDIDNEEDEDDDDGGSGVQRIGKDDYDDGDGDDEDDDYGDSQRHPKKRKLKSLMSSFEFAPRVPAAPTPLAAVGPKTSHGGRNPLTDWTEHETFVLLDAWGDRFLKQGRKSLRSEEWQEVADKVSQESRIERTDTQCRNRLDTLKKKYKKEKMKVGQDGAMCKWVYFKKMDSLLSSSPQQTGLSCGLDSGEYVFMNSKVYLNRANVLDEMRDSPGNSDSAEAEDDDSEGLPPKRTKSRGSGEDSGSSFKLLADSIHKFSEIYEKIETSKRQQLLELEKMRMEFLRDLEHQKRQILERARAQITKIRRGDDDENDMSAENVSG